MFIVTKRASRQEKSRGEFDAGAGILFFYGAGLLCVGAFVAVMLRRHVRATGAVTVVVVATDANADAPPHRAGDGGAAAIAVLVPSDPDGDRRGSSSGGTSGSDGIEMVTSPLHRYRDAVDSRSQAYAQGQGAQVAPARHSVASSPSHIPPPPPS
jgi:hypothetical protein